MNAIERRHLASRFVRYWSIHGKLAIVLTIFGWSLIASAEVGPPVAQDGNAFETMKLMLGGAILIFGVVAGVTKWLIEPAILRGIALHKKESGDAHPVYITREEWDRKHTALDTKIDKVKDEILEAIGKARTRRHE